MIRSFIKVVPKGWGREEWVSNSALYCGKLLTVLPSKRCSLHYHEQKTETFHVLKGQIKMELEGEVRFMTPGMTVDIFPYQKHRFTGVEEVNVILEVSTQHFEADSIRVEVGDQL
jgi:mannose-6-phosphate isomerase-like protein (cupin superfamily)